MASSTAAHLAFGVVIEGDAALSLPWDAFTNNVSEFDEWITDIAGLSDPTAGSGLNWEEWFAAPENAKTGKAYWEADRLARQATPIDEIVFDTVSSKVMIIVRGTNSHVAWDRQVIPAITTVTTQQIEAAAAFCAEHDIPFTDPQWLIVASND